MSLYVLDTDHLTLYFYDHPVVKKNMLAHASDELSISIVTVDEQVTGWYLLARKSRRPAELARAYARLGETVVRLSKWRILPYTESAIAEVARLKTLKLNVGTMDLRIAAIAKENQAIVITRNSRDFGRIPGLRFEDWSV